MLLQYLLQHDGYESNPWLFVSLDSAVLPRETPLFQPAMGNFALYGRVMINFKYTVLRQKTGGGGGRRGERGKGGGEKEKEEKEEDEGGEEEKEE
ncbi:hypothetical protein PoB_002356300 [Plakobranchus ocellatus]|uniref:Uncharacterized protein n=1 Tax=Plakobranchus ocellatus TaxID=259542 RepID=A0AAV3ZRH7_9GAST|nr:hypothetical protein PoB_002356300 [Plakobranchus ocellatus]